MAKPEPAAKRWRCAITGHDTPRKDLMRLDALRPGLAERMRADHPRLGDAALVGRAAIGRYLSAYVEDLLRSERGEISELDRQVAQSLASQETIAANVEADYAERRSLGERLSDGLATFGGSWTFLIAFALVLVLWIAANLVTRPEAFDPYPFILLNLVLSCIAAVQAPIIMMSQRRQEAKDRLRTINDYKVNLKAELEIRHLHEKLDHLMSRQWRRLAEIQQIQLDLMQESRRAK